LGCGESERSGLPQLFLHPVPRRQPRARRCLPKILNVATRWERALDMSVWVHEGPRRRRSFLRHGPRRERALSGEACERPSEAQKGPSPSKRARRDSGRREGREATPQQGSSARRRCVGMGGLMHGSVGHDSVGGVSSDGSLRTQGNDGGWWWWRVMTRARKMTLKPLLLPLSHYYPGAVTFFFSSAHMCL